MFLSVIEGLTSLHLSVLLLTTISKNKKNVEKKPHKILCKVDPQ